MVFYCRKAKASFCTAILNQLGGRDAQLTSSSFASLLRWCGREKAFLIGKQSHHHLISSGLEKNTFLANLLLQMYCDCGALGDALGLFSRMGEGNEYTWRIIIVAYVHDGKIEAALQLFEEMEGKGVIPDRLTFITVITACSKGGRAYLDTGKRVHYLIFICQLDSDVVVGNALITMYGKNDSTADARRTFDNMPSRDVVSWNAMIAAYTNEGRCNEALDLFKQMEQERLIPDKFTFIGILTAFASQSALVDGIHVHNLILDSRFKSDVTVGNALINMYGSCGSLEGAQRTFDTMVERNTITWTAMLAVHAEHGDGLEVLQLYQQLQQECVMPNKITFVTYLDACTNQEALAAGKQMHACIIGSQITCEVVVETALVNMYGKCGSLQVARGIFNNMPQRSIISWGTMITIYAHHALAKEALQLLEQMQQEAEVADRVVFISILDACASQAALKEGQQVHAWVVGSRNHLDVPLSTALVKMYAKCSRLEDAKEIFNSMPDRNAYSWNAMIAGYMQLEEGKLALQFFEHMQQESVMPDKVTFLSIFSACGNEMDLPSGKQMHALFWSSEFQSDIFLWNGLVSMYGRCGNPEEAQRVFDKMSERNAVSWNAVTAAYAQNGRSKESLNLFNLMEQEGINPDKATFAVILSACSHGGLVNEAFQIFDSMIQEYGIKPLVDHYNCMIDLLARAGRLDEAEILLQRMPCKPNTISLMTLLGACRLQNDVGRGEYVAMRVFLLDPGNAAPFVMLSNIYASAETHNGGEYVEPLA